jgi:hypothetical protein
MSYVATTGSYLNFPGFMEEEKLVEKPLVAITAVWPKSKPNMTPEIFSR